MNNHDASTLKTNRSQIGNSFNQQVERPNILQIPLQEEPYGLGDETETMTKTYLTNSEEDRFNESLITFLTSQQDLKINSHYT